MAKLLNRNVRYIDVYTNKRERSTSLIRKSKPNTWKLICGYKHALTSTLFMALTSANDCQNQRKGCSTTPASARVVGIFQCAFQEQVKKNRTESGIPSRNPFVNVKERSVKERNAIVCFVRYSRYVGLFNSGYSWTIRQSLWLCFDVLFASLL